MIKVLTTIRPPTPKNPKGWLRGEIHGYVYEVPPRIFATKHLIALITTPCRLWSILYPKLTDA